MILRRNFLVFVLSSTLVLILTHSFVTGPHMFSSDIPDKPALKAKASYLKVRSMLIDKDDEQHQRQSLQQQHQEVSLLKKDLTALRESERKMCEGNALLNANKPLDSNSFVTFKKFAEYGRLGNQLFQYAALKAIAKYYGVKAKLPRNWWERSTQGQVTYMRNFNISIEEMTSEDENACCKTEYDEKQDDRFAFNQVLLDNNPLPINLQGYFLSWKYLCNIMEDIRAEFQVTAPFKQKATSTLVVVKERFVAAGTATQESVIVGVHIRRGDILAQQDWFKTPTASYIHAAMKTFQDSYHQPIFVVCSGGHYSRDDSDVEWCKKELNAPNIYFSHNTVDFDDFALLSNCDHAIFTSGTFGWWAAWMTGGQVIAWPHWQRQSWYIGHERDFFPPTWMLLDEE